MRTNVSKAYRVLLRISAKLLDLLVDLIGIEPMTSSMPWKRAPNCATGPLFGVQSYSACLMSVRQLSSLPWSQKRHSLGMSIEKRK